MPINLFLCSWLLLGAFSSFAASDSKTKTAANQVDFNRDIRPIFSDNCYACHGPDKNKRKAGLRLDVKEGAFVKLEEGDYAIVPGDAAKSKLLKMVTSTNDEDRMPPPKTGKKLTAAQIDLLRRWIEQGAEWQAHWSYIPPVRPATPTVKKRQWLRNEIDAFILARLEREGVKPAPEGDKTTLLRRLSFDLTGLPPSPEEAHAFKKDTSRRAYEQLVDRLMASPHFGERMAMHWLDLVRYADTDGFHSDNYRSVYPFRDYVIKAFNDNLPFDRFTIEQLAGDLLPKATLSQRIASTFNRLNRTTEEGGSQPKEYLAKYAADRVRTVSGVWLGATMGCSECHDHKFDPLSTRDFYRMEAFFADVKEEGVAKPEPVPLLDDQQSLEYNPIYERVENLKREMEATTNRLVAVQTQWEANLLADLDAGRLAWAPVKPDSVAARNGTTLTVQEDLSVLASGENPTNDNYTVTIRTDREQITALRLEALVDPTLDKKSFSRGGGNFVLTGFEVALALPDHTSNQPVKIKSAIADFSQKDFPVSNAIDAKAETGWAVDGENNITNRQAAFIFAKPVAGGPGTTLSVQLKHESKLTSHNMGRFRLALSTVIKPNLSTNGLAEDVIEALRTPKSQRINDQQQALANYYLGNHPDLEQLKEQLDDAKKKKDEFIAKYPTSLITIAVEPRVMRVLRRGDWMDDSGEIATPAVPAFFQKQESMTQRATRRDLAEWLVSRDNPLTARVFVNRLWKLYFGTGISKNLDDLGSQGEWPQHPELLDWLAMEFTDHGWDVKHVIKLIVMSNTYRQSSTHPDPKLKERDPYNRWLARQSRLRLDAEIVRDNALAVSGLMVDKVGGASVKPYQPAGYWDQLNFPKRTWQHDKGEALYRRGLYTFWCRSFLHPSLLAFDASSREECNAERVTSNTPLQALTLLNDPIYVEASRVFAENILRHGGKTADERINWTFERALSRKPSKQEKQVLTGLQEKQLRRFAADGEAAKKLVSVGEYPVPKDLDLAELAAWTSVSRTVLNLHETITRF